MHIKVFDNLSLGKLGSKNKKDIPATKDTKAAKVAEIEKKMSGKAKKLEKAAEELHELAATKDITKIIDTAPARPHGPAGELEVEPEDQETSAGITLDEVENIDSIKLGEEIKIAEVSAVKVAAAKAAPTAAAKATSSPAPAAPVEEKKEAKPDDNESLNNLFSTNEEEENPLASLINSLPDVTARELIDDLSEIHRIIKEWNPSSK
jgi:hypothetical protein